jgi:threonine dehydrogenase-like Zn-dependent dehydrogenase
VKAWRVSVAGLQLDDVVLPTLQDGWAEIAVEVFQVSVTEALALNGSSGVEQDAIAAALGSREPTQLFGHEFCGTIVAIGGNDQNLEVGLRVVSLPTFPCRHCTACRAGAGERCDSRQVVGVHVSGCFAERVRLPLETLVMVPDSVASSSAAAAQPLSSCIAAMKSYVTSMPGEPVVVIGLGPMGLFLIQLARLYGANPVVGVARRPETHEAAMRLGADLVAVPDDCVDCVRELTNGRGAKFVFEAAGAERGVQPMAFPALQLAASVCSAGGTIIETGTFEGPFEFDANAGFRTKYLRYAFKEPADLQDLQAGIELLANGEITVPISHRFGSLDALPQAISTTLDKGQFSVVGTVQVSVNSR